MFEMSQPDMFGNDPWSPTKPSETVREVETQSSWIDPVSKKWVDGSKPVTICCDSDGKPRSFDAGARGQGEIERWEGDVGYGTFRTPDGRAHQGKVTLIHNAYGGTGFEYAIGNGATNVAEGRGRL